MMFKIINLADGSQKDCDIVNLSRSLSPNCEIMRIIDDKFEAIGFVSHSLLVFFTVEAAQYALQKYTKKTIPEAEICINLTKKWIKDSSSVSKDELKAAAYAAAYAADAVAHAAYAAAADAANAAANAAAYNAAYAAAAYASSYAADAAADAAAYDAAAYAADAVDDAADAGREKEFIRQANFILKYFNAL
jgi:hypothetical protein